MTKASEFPLSRTEAQSRTDDIQAFQRELKHLLNEQVIMLDPEQRASIRHYHQQLLTSYEQKFEIDRSTSAKQLSLGMRIASFIGALALAVSLFFFFQYFWGLLSQSVQVVILIATSCLSFALTIVVQRKDRSGYFTKLAAMFSYAAFVINIGMLGLIFSLTPSDKALLLWAAYGFLLAYICDARLLLIGGIMPLIGFIGARTGTWGGMYWLGAGEYPENFLPAAIIIFSIPLLLSQRRFDGFAMTYRICGLITFFIPILILSNAGRASYFTLPIDTIEALYQAAGFICSALVIWLGIRRHWRDTVNTGITFFTLFLYTKIFDWWWDSMPKYLFFMILGLIAILILLMLRRLHHTQHMSALTEPV